VTGADATADELASVEERLARLREELDDVGDSLEDGDAFEVALSQGTESGPPGPFGECEAVRRTAKRRL